MSKWASLIKTSSIKRPAKSRDSHSKDGVNSFCGFQVKSHHLVFITGEKSDSGEICCGSQGELLGIAGNLCTLLVPGHGEISSVVVLFYLPSLVGLRTF